MMRMGKGLAASSANGKTEAGGAPTKVQPTIEASPEVSPPAQKAEPLLESPQSIADESGIFFGRCLHPGAGNLGYEHQEYCFLEGHEMPDQSDVGKLMDIWRLQPPNLVISLTSPAAPHPKALVFPEALKQKDLEPIVKQATAVLQLQAKRRGPDTEPKPTQSPDTPAAPHALAVPAAVELADAVPQEKLLSFIGDKFHEKNISVFTALIDACAQTNSWLVVDASSGLVTYLLEEALSRTKSRPVILCIANYTDNVFHKSDTQKQAWDQLRRRATHIATDGSSADLAVVGMSPDLMPESLGECWKYHVEFTRESYADRHPWGSWPFRGATHYIFADSGKLPDLSWFGPGGNLFFNGGSTQANKMYRSIFAGSPCVLLKHSGRAADFWSYLLEFAMRDGVGSADALLEKLDACYPFWYDFAGDLYGVGGLQDKVLTYASGLSGLPQSRLAQLRSSVVVIDAWADSPEAVLRRLSSCFASNTGGILELGANTAEEDVIVTALEQQLLLEYNSQLFGRRANLMTVMGLCLSFTSTIVAVVSTFVETQAAEHWAKLFLDSVYWTACNWLLVALPAAAGFFVSVLSRLRYTAKWGALYMAARQLESEVYKYRIKAGEYDLSQSVGPQDRNQRNREKANGKGDKKPASQSTMSAARARQMFVTRTCSVFSQVIGSEMQEDALMLPDDLSASLKQRLQQATEDSIARITARKAGTKKLRQAQDDPEAGLLVQQLEEERDDTRPDDLISTLTAEEYFEHRVLPELHKFRALAPRLSWRLTFYEVLIFLASLAGTLLGACRLKEWIPVAVSLSSVLTSLLQFESLHGRLAAINSAIRDLNLVVAQWRSFGVVEKRTRSVKKFVVELTEHAIVGEAIAYVAGAAQASKVTAPDGDPEREGQDGEEQTRKTKAS